MQYNILSQQLSQSHVYVEKKYLHINYRFKLLCDIIKQSNCDIICLQEVDGTKTFHIKNPMHIGQKLPFMDKN
jgi:mRNA deadenylase 3'-5' endonuclease subunit Ccr4